METKLKGVWWLPEQPDKQLHGEITFSPTAGAELSLYGSFYDNLSTKGFTVWGTAANGRPVTLFECRTVNIKRHLPGAKIANVFSYFGIVGDHYSSPDQLNFTKLTADLSFLREWSCMSGIEWASDAAGDGWQVRQTMIPKISLGSWNDIELTLEFTARLSPDFGNVTLTETCVLALTAKSPRSYDMLEDLLHKVQHFVALGVSRPVYALRIICRSEDAKQVIEGQTIYSDFEVIRKLSLTTEKERVLPHDMQFCLSNLKPEPAAFLTTFLQKHDRLEPVYDLYFATLYNREMYVHQRFLALAHAVEAYHRAFIGGKYQADDEYRTGLQKTLWEAIPSTVDANFKASLKNKLKYLHEYSLRKRLQDICGKFTSLLHPFIGDSSAFSGFVADQRNTLTHPDSTAEEKPAPINWSDLWVRCEQLSLLLETCFLHEIGFSEESIKTLLPRNSRTRAIQLNLNRS